MFKHHFTLYFGLKTAICFLGAVACELIGQSGSTLFTVAALSLLATPLVGYLESQQ